MMKLKAIIFDLDDTLFDSSGTWSKEARIYLARAMAAAGLKAKEDDILKKVNEIFNSPRLDLFMELKKVFNIKDEKIMLAARNAFYSDEDNKVDNIKLFPGTLDMLKALHSYLLILVTLGNPKLQQKKIDVLGIKDEFNYIRLVDIKKSESKRGAFIEVMKKFNLKPREVICVGDRINSEIKISNELGIISVRMLHGRFKDLKPKYSPERPDYEIKKMSELPKILRHDLNKLANDIKHGDGL